MARFGLDSWFSSQSKHRVAIATFWRTFHHDGIISSVSTAWWGWGVHALPLSLYLPSLTKLWCTLELRGPIHSPYFSSTPICTQCFSWWALRRIHGWGITEKSWESQRCNIKTKNINSKFFAINYKYGLELEIVLSAHLFMRPCSKERRRESMEYFHLEGNKTSRLHMKELKFWIFSLAAFWAERMCYKWYHFRTIYGG